MQKSGVLVQKNKPKKQLGLTEFEVVCLSFKLDGLK